MPSLSRGERSVALLSDSVCEVLILGDRLEHFPGTSMLMHLEMAHAKEYLRKSALVYRLE
jgi:hypothetical protein